MAAAKRPAPLVVALLGFCLAPAHGLSLPAGPRERQLPRIGTADVAHQDSDDVNGVRCGNALSRQRLRRVVGALARGSPVRRRRPISI